jgi:hypothetical protein
MSNMSCQAVLLRCNDDIRWHFIHVESDDGLRGVIIFYSKSLYFLLAVHLLLIILEYTQVAILFPHFAKMKELVRDTVVGHLLRLATGGRALKYEEERDKSLWKRYIDKEKSGRMAHHGTVEENQDEEHKEQDASDIDAQGQQGARVAERNTTTGARNSSDTRVGSGEAQRNEVSGVPVDPEKGRDVTIVTWFGDNDPEVSRSQGCNMRN